MIARGSGHIVNTASLAGLYPYAANRLPYAASKAALINMSENLALYLHPLGVRVSCLCPGPTMTTMGQGMKTWSENVVMRGPGSEFDLRSQEHAATVLADGMSAGRIIVHTHEVAEELVRSHGDDPDAFVQARIDAYAAGDTGLPAFLQAKAPPPL
jgi:NAD(P)-dependent dehydrogenase (short-subunit alcohol dehydrogenase family)